MSSRTVAPLPPRTRRSTAIRLRVVSSILAFLLAVWIFYPVEVYRGHIPTYLAVAEINGESTFAGVVKVTPCEHPVLAARELGKRCHPRHSSQPLPGGAGVAHWSFHPGGASPGTLSWRTANLLWTLEPADSFGTHARGTPEWTRAMIESAETAMTDFREGTLKSSQVATKRTSLGVILLEHAVATLRGWW